MLLLMGDFICHVGILAVLLVFLAKLICFVAKIEFDLFKFFMMVAVGIFCAGGLALFIGRML